MQYKKPNSGFPKLIWESACLPDECDEETIKISLDLWVTWNAQTYCKPDNTYYITWTAPNGQTITANYYTFHRWILCACTPGARQQQNLSSETATV